MRKLFLSVLAVFVMVGIAFMPSSAWSLAPDTEVCSLSEYSGESSIAAVHNVDWAVNQENVFQADNAICNASVNFDRVAPAVATFEELGVSSLFYISCNGCHTVNPQLDPIFNGIVQKRVDILLC